MRVARANRLSRGRATAHPRNVQERLGGSERTSPLASVVDGRNTPARAREPMPFRGRPRRVARGKDGSERGTRAGTSTRRAWGRGRGARPAIAPGAAPRGERHAGQGTGRTGRGVAREGRGRGETGRAEGRASYGAAQDTRQGSERGTEEGDGGDRAGASERPLAGGDAAPG